MVEQKQIIDVDFYRDDNLPVFLQEEAKKQNIKIKKGLIAVKFMKFPLSYDFYMIGKNPKNLSKFYNKLAKEDGVNLNKALKNLMK